MSAPHATKGTTRSSAQALEEAEPSVLGTLARLEGAIPRDLGDEQLEARVVEVGRRLGPQAR